MSIFKETNFITFNPNHYPNIFIYFLMHNDKVVYIGQTERGLMRLFSHIDKTFDVVKIIECKFEELDLLETKFILKYQPPLNKLLPTNGAYSINRLKKIYTKIFKIKINKNQLARLLNKFDIKTHVFNGISYVLKGDADCFLNCIKEGKYE